MVLPDSNIFIEYWENKRGKSEEIARKISVDFGWTFRTHEERIKGFEVGII